MEFLQQNIMWVALAVVSGGMLLWPLVAGGSVAKLTPAQATLLMNREDALVLDVRETGEWTSGHIPGARHITLVTDQAYARAVSDAVIRVVEAARTGRALGL